MQILTDNYCHGIFLPIYAYLEVIMIFHPALKTPHDLQQELAAKAKALRLSMNLSQQDLARQSGVSLGSLRRFEQSGEISLKSLLNIAWALGGLKEFSLLFAPGQNISLFQKPVPKRKRSRKPKRAAGEE